jgi:acyl carrier protein
MMQQEILRDLNEVFRLELADPSVHIDLESTAQDVEGWDSLSHIQIVVAVEKHFKVRFTAGEIQGFQNVGDMCQTIMNKLARR